MLILTLSVVAVLLAQVVHQQVYAWNLDFDLTDSTFGSDRVCAEIHGPYGYERYRCTDASPYASVSFNVPEDEVPEGYNYQVCVWGGLLSFVLKNCQMFPHGSGDEWVQLSVGR